MNKLICLIAFFLVFFLLLQPIFAVTDPCEGKSKTVCGGITGCEWISEWNDCRDLDNQEDCELKGCEPTFESIDCQAVVKDDCPGECTWVDCSCGPASVPNCVRHDNESDCSDAGCSWEGSAGVQCGCIGASVQEFDDCSGGLYNEAWCEYVGSMSTCAEEWICNTDGTGRKYITENCLTSQTETCEHGCAGGECNAAPVVVSPSPSPSASLGSGVSCVAGWTCVPGTQNWREKLNANCEVVEKQNCSDGCINGQCQCARKTCSYFYSQGSCGSNFSDGCGGTLNCTSCSSGQECVNGNCVCDAKTSCGSGVECGFESDGCGGSINCGSCNPGFECDLSVGSCALKQLPTELELSNVSVSAYSNHAVVSWVSSIEASSLVKFGTGSLTESVRVSGNSTEHVVVLTNLEPLTPYVFQVESSANGKTVSSAMKSFTTTEPKLEGFKVLFVLVNPSSEIQREGQSFSFTAVTTALNQDSVEFEWDFGDGTGDSSGARVFHSYYGLGAVDEKSFTVKVTATDSNGAVSTAEKTVKVLKADFRAVVLKPEPFEKQSKDSLLEFRIAFVDREEKVIGCGKVDLRLLFNNSVVPMKCTESEYFVGSVMPWHGLKSLELMEINASYEGKGAKHFTSTRFPVYFKSLDVKATPVFGDKLFYLFDRLDDSTFMFLLNDIIVISPTELKAELVSASGTKEVNVVNQGFEFLVEFDYEISESDFMDGLELKLSGKDDLGNEIFETQVVPLGEENPELTVALISPRDFDFAFGQTVEFKTRILSVNYALVERKVFIESKTLGLFEEMQLDVGKGEYSFFVELPELDSGIESVDFKFFGHGVAGEREIADLEFAEISLSNNLGVEIVFPMEAPEKTGILGTELNEVKLRVLQPNGELFKDKELDAVVTVDGVPETVVLKFNAKSGEYSAVLENPVELGEHSVNVSLFGNFQGSKQITSSIEQDLFVFQALGLLVGGIILLAVLVVLSFVYRNIVSERRFLISEKERLIGLRKSFKFEFYKRHINQLEFNSAITQVNTGIKGINSLMKRKWSWFYVGLMKTFYRSNDYHSLPENLQVALLVNRLAGRRGEYSRGEIRKVMAEEGYADLVIEQVIIRLYGEPKKQVK